MSEAYISWRVEGAIAAGLMLSPQSRRKPRSSSLALKEEEEGNLLLP
jgi:hypothetical protein